MTDRDAASGLRPVADRPRPVSSRFYTAISDRMDGEGLAALRAELLAPLSGAVVEIGAGDGRNFARYPTAVTQVTAVEPEPRLRARATQLAAVAPVPVTVVPGTAESLPLPDASCDAAVLASCCARCPTAAPRWPRLPGCCDPGGCHTATDPVGLIEAAGFAVTAVRRLRFPESRFTQPAAPHVLGLARRPS